jgi:hypothetical protein
MVIGFSLFYRYQKGSWQEELVSIVLEDMLFFRDLFKTSPYYRLEVPDTGWATRSKDIKWAFSKNPDDYRIVGDFYKKLVDRNLRLKSLVSPTNSETIREINKDIENHIIKMQETIHWEEYGKEPAKTYEKYVREYKNPSYQRLDKTYLYKMTGYPRLAVIPALLLPGVSIAFVFFGQVNLNLGQWESIIRALIGTGFIAFGFVYYKIMIKLPKTPTATN